MSNGNEELGKARAQIDAIDTELQALISQRARVAEQVREIKERNGGAVGDHYRPAREAEVLKRAMARNQGPLPDEMMAHLMREIMSACLALESPLSVSYLGPEGTYTQAAVYKHFGHQVAARAVSAIDEIFRDVESGIAAYGVVPIENSTEGVVTSTLDLLANTPLSICGEVWLPVHHQLLTRHESFEDVQVIYAHPQSFAQCRRWLDTRLPGAAREPMASNGAAAKRVAESGQGAAIASAAAGELYGLKVLAANVEDDPNNTTRFLVIGRGIFPPSGNDRTSLLVSVRDKPGALYDILRPLAERGISMNRIESRPSHTGKWQYAFFIDISGHVEDEGIQDALKDMEPSAADVRVLGAYPVALP